MVKFFKKSNLFMERIEEYARGQPAVVNGQNAKLIRLKQRGNTRWNSVYDMLHSVIANRSMSLLIIIIILHLSMQYLLIYTILLICQYIIIFLIASIVYRVVLLS